MTRLLESSSESAKNFTLHSSGYIDLRINLRINLRIDPEVVSDWLSGDGVGEDDGAAP